MKTKIIALRCETKTIQQ